MLRKFTIFVVLALVVAGLVVWRNHTAILSDVSDRSAGATNPPVGNPAAANSQTQPFNKNQYSTNDPASLWVVVNKGRILPSDYAPSLVVPDVSNHYGNKSNDSHLQPAAGAALEQMFAAARQAGYSLQLYSGYRSYEEQVDTYDSFVTSSGLIQADTFSARPGHSEHQTGLAADIASVGGSCTLDQCFGDTPEGKWLADNSYKFGFILRYQKNTQDLTGYEYEPWHFRFVGTGLAAELNKNGQTLEQFFNLPTYKLNTPYPDNPFQLKTGE